MIESYINNSFCLIDAKHVVSMENYHKIISDILSGFEVFLKETHLIEAFPKYSVRLICAFDKSSSALLLKNELHLIINRYFVQSLNNLNKIFFHNLGEQQNNLPMFTYIFRLMKEQAYVSGFPEYAIFLEQFIKLKLNSEVELVWKSPENKSHGNLTPIHEAFIVAHEVVHLLVSEGLLAIDFKNRDNTLNTLYSLIINRKDNLDPKIDRLISNLKSVDDADFDEELFCDRIAFEFVLKYFAKVYTYSEIHAAVRIFHMHMRVLEVFSSAFAVKPELLLEDSTFSPPLMVRNWSRSLQADLISSEDSDQVHDSMKLWMDYNEIHHNKITQVVLNTIKRKNNIIRTASLEFDLLTRKFGINVAH